MGRLEWANVDYTYGVERGVLHFPQQPYADPHVPRVMAWDGLSGVETVEAGGELVTTWYQGEKVYISQSHAQFEGRIQAFTYPDVLESEESHGFDPQYSIRPLLFHLTFETNGSRGRRIHILYNVQLKSGSKTLKTSTSSIEPSTFQWTAHTSPVPVPGARPTSYIILEIDEDSPFSWELEGILYGDDGMDPRVPMPDEIDDILSSAATLRITEYPDGTYEASGPDDVVEVLDDGQFRINAPTVGTINNAMGIFRVSSY